MIEKIRRYFRLKPLEQVFLILLTVSFFVSLLITWMIVTVTDLVIVMMG